MSKISPPSPSSEQTFLRGRLMGWKKKLAAKSTNSLGVQPLMAKDDEKDVDDSLVEGVDKAPVSLYREMSDKTYGDSAIRGHRCCTYLNLEPQYCDQSEADLSFNCLSAKCKICLDLDRNLYPTRMVERILAPNRQIFTTVMNLAAARKKGCSKCSILYQGYKNFKKRLQAERSKSATSLSSSIISIRLRPVGPVAMRLHDPKNSNERYFASLEFYCREEHESPHPAFGHSQDISPFLSKSDSISFILRHVIDCNKNHSLCSERRILEQHPERLLDIGLGNGPNVIKLITVNGSSLPYIAVSHCWGNNNRVKKTTTANIQQQVNGFPETDLPKTLLHAAQIARAVGIQYLWIDSLCIIQDDHTDWETESVKMADVYSGSFLTIAATKSPDDFGGLFSNRYSNSSHRSQRKFDPKRDSIEAFLISGTSNEGRSKKKYHVSVRQKLRIAHEHAKCYTSFSSANTAPLLQRAWCFQERILATRIVHFHVDELIWQCKSCTACECGFLQTKEKFQHPPKPSRAWVDPDSVWDVKRTLALILEGHLQLSETYHTWRTVVELYSELAITQESDRLPALSGIASRLAPILDDSYIAGLWAGDLPAALAWSRSALSLGSKRLTVPGVPTWSWASIQNTYGAHGVNYAKLHGAARTFMPDRRFKVLSFNRQPLTKNPFGPLAETRLSLKGACILVEYAYIPEFSPSSGPHAPDPSEKPNPGVGNPHKLLHKDGEDCMEFLPDAVISAGPYLALNATELVVGEKLLCICIGAWRRSGVMDAYREKTRDGGRDGGRNSYGGRVDSGFSGLQKVGTGLSSVRSRDGSVGGDGGVVIASEGAGDLALVLKRKEYREGVWRAMEEQFERVGLLAIGHEREWFRDAKVRSVVVL